MGSVVGTLDTFSVYSHELQQERTVRVLTPPGLPRERPCPVIYLHDGQNLFDVDLAYAGEWEVDEALAAFCHTHGRGAIAVGIDNTPNRFNELCPARGISDGVAEGLGGSWREVITHPCGDSYAAFVVGTLMPLIAGRYPVATDRAHTFVGGSSMGGLMSLYMAARYPGLFSGAIVFSPALLVLDDAEKRALFELARSGIGDARLCFYVGGEGFERGFVPDTRHFANGLADGARHARISYVEKPQNGHCEAAWRAAFPAALEFLLT